MLGNYCGRVGKLFTRQNTMYLLVGTFFWSCWEINFGAETNTPETESGRVGQLFRAVLGNYSGHVGKLIRAVLGN